MSKTRKKEPQMAQGETDHCGHFIEEETEAQSKMELWKGPHPKAAEESKLRSGHGQSPPLNHSTALPPWAQCDVMSIYWSGRATGPKLG